MKSEYAANLALASSTMRLSSPCPIEQAYQRKQAVQKAKQQATMSFADRLKMQLEEA